MTLDRRSPADTCPRPQPGGRPLDRDGDDDDDDDDDDDEDNYDDDDDREDIDAHWLLLVILFA